MASASPRPADRPARRPGRGWSPSWRLATGLAAAALLLGACQATGAAPDAASSAPDEAIGAPPTVGPPEPGPDAPGPAASASGTPAPSASATGTAPATPAGFRASSRPLTAAEQQAMTGVTWRPGCPVPLAELRRLTVTHHTFDGATADGVLVVHESAVEPLTQAFADLYAAGFQIRRMEPIEAYGGDDWTSIEADNTSAFNCRLRTGSRTEWSRHSYGLAIDVNPLENPYVRDGTTSHPRSRPYLDRAHVRPGMLTPGSPAVAAFTRIGWHWGGTWANPVDLQHFSDNGR